MPITTQCPYCQKKFRAADKVAGKPVKCPGCKKVVRVPEKNVLPKRVPPAGTAPTGRFLLVYPRGERRADGPRHQRATR